MVWASSVNYGFPAHSDEEYLSTVVPLMKSRKVRRCFCPGMARSIICVWRVDLGVHTIRVATHCAETDVSEQHISMARQWGMDTVGFLMMAHMNTPEGLVKQGQLMGYGANCIYVTDSAGICCRTIKGAFGGCTCCAQSQKPNWFHAITILAMGIANSTRPLEAGATDDDAAAARPGRWCGQYADGSVHRRGRSRWALKPAWTYSKIQDVAEDIVVPMMDHIIRVDRDSLTLGYAGVYSSFLLFAKRAEKNTAFRRVVAG